VPRAGLRRSGEEELRVTNLELFFDLVYVFAITQLSQFLLGHLDAGGAAKTLLLLLVVWWAWGYTTWMTNWFDPDAIPVRLVLIVVMLASLGMSIAIPQAFGDRALLFAGSYVALQAVRNCFVVWATAHGDPLHAGFQRILAWGLGAGALWIAGALAPERWRVPIWVVALAVDYAGPALRYRTPGLGRSEFSEWVIEGGLFAERFQLFIIIALGESIVVTGATASKLDLDLATAVSIAVAFAGSAALWWLYFDYVASSSSRRLRVIAETGRAGRDAFTYIHILLIAGIVATAVADEVVIAHPDHALHGASLAVAIAGPALYLVGHLAFRWRMTGRSSGLRAGGVVAVVLVTPLGLVAPALATLAAVNLVLAGLVVLETLGYGRPPPRQRRARPSAA